MLDQKGDLAAAELAFFSIATIVTAFALIQQGFARHLGWLYIGILSVLQVLGASCLLYTETRGYSNSPTLEAAYITSAVGTGPLLLAMMGFLERIVGNMQTKSVPMLVFQPLHLLSLVALILAIVGAVKSFDSNRDTARTDKSLFEAASIIFLAVWIALTTIAATCLVQNHFVARGDRKLLYAAMIALPLISVRVIYTVCIAFAGTSSIFSLGITNVWAQAFMRFLMEAIAVAILVTVGLKVSRVESAYTYDLSKNEPHGRVRACPRRDGHGYVEAHQARRTGQHQSVEQKGQKRFRGVMDYMPSKLLRDAIRDRNQTRAEI